MGSEMCIRDRQCDAREAGLARVFEVDDRWFRLGDHGRYPALNKSRTLPNSKQHRDDLLIGDDKWITFVQHDWANVDWLYIDEIIEPLSPLFDQLEIHCVA